MTAASCNCVAVVACVALLLGVGGASAHGSGAGSILYGSGTAVIDGTLTPGEWAGARRLDFDARLPAHDGGGTVATTIRAMNDTSTLFVSLEVGRGTYGGNTSFALYFDNDHDGIREVGDDAFLADVGTFSPVRFLDWHWNSCTPGGPGIHCPVFDSDRGGTTEGTSAAGIAAGKAVIEASHPLDSSDDGHDFSLGPGAVAGFAALVTLWSADTSCNFGDACYAHTVVPIGLASHGETSDYGHLVVSPDLIAPETGFAGGPSDGGLTNVRDVTFVLSASDNLTPDEQMRFACSLDEAAFADCSARPAFASLAEGLHRLQARATDELGNLDPTPAARRWTVDVTPPETSIDQGPTEGALTNERDAFFVFAGNDNFTPSGQLAFTCSLDDRPFSSCGARAPFDRLRDGRHRLAARASDAAGNVDQSPVIRQWTIDATAPSRPRVRVRVRGLVARVRLSAADAGGRRVRFRCALDRKRFRACASTAKLRLKRGRHVLRAITLDAAGNRSGAGIARFRTAPRRR